jgi:hypothetical protein
VSSQTSVADIASQHSRRRVAQQELEDVGKNNAWLRRDGIWEQFCPFVAKGHYINWPAQRAALHVELKPRRT